MTTIKISKVITYYFIILFVFPIITNNIVTLTILGGLLGLWGIKIFSKSRFIIESNLEYILMVLEILLLVILHIFNFKRDNYILNRILIRLLLIFIFMVVYKTAQSDFMKHNVKKNVINFTIYAFDIVAITTIIGLIRFPMAARELAGSAGNNSIVYQLNNIGGYGFIYSLSFLIPIFVYMLFHGNVSRKSKSLFLISIVLMSIAVLISKYVIAICFTLIFSFLAFLSKRGKHVVILGGIGSGIFLIFITIGKNIVYDFFYPIVSSINNGVIRVRVLGLLELLVNGSIDANISSRYDAYRLSWENFLQHPFFGKLFQDVDITAYNHSELLDILSCLGIFGSILLIFSFVLYFIHLNTELKHYNMESISTILSIEFLCFSILNTIFTASEVFVVITVIATEIPLFSYAESHNEGGT